MCNSTINGGTLSHRTRLMEAEQAERFAKMIGANSRFAEAQVVRSERAKSERAFYVSYSPASEAARLRMLDEQRAEQERRAAVEEFTFTWDATLGAYKCSSAKSGKVYETTTSACSCPQALYRLAGTTLTCKHSVALLSALEDGLVGEEEAAERCENCNALTAERVTVHAEDGPDSIALCEACAEESDEQIGARLAVNWAPQTPVMEAREEQRRLDQERFASIFGTSNEEWMK